MSAKGSEESMVSLKSGKAMFILNPMFAGKVTKTVKSRANMMTAQELISIEALYITLMT